jgi:DNA polymerase-1
MTIEMWKAGPNPAFPFREVWLVDFEFQLDGGKHLPLCLVAREYYSKREYRRWRDELVQLSAAPFDTGSDSCFVAYMAAAELNCFLALGWPLPANVLDLAQEHKRSVNVGRRGKSTIGWRLTDALRYRGLVHAMADEKPELVALILSSDSFDDDEAALILDYCASDVDALAQLLPVMLPTIDLSRAIGFRGRYMTAVARMESAGVPFDIATFDRIRTHLPLVARDLIREGDRATNCYRADGSFSLDLFEAFLTYEGLSWDRTDLGRPRLDSDYVRTRAAAYPKLRDFYELRTTLSLLRGLTASSSEAVDAAGKRLKGLMPSSDGFIRCSLWAFGSATGRNQPQASQFIFGPATWLRGLIKPPPGFGVAYIDWSQQEFALAAGLSGDAKMAAAYQSGDVYMAFAIAAGMVPPGANKANPEHAAIRDVCKNVVLGMSYGKGFASIARDANIPLPLAKTLYEAHKTTYATFWAWIDSVITTTVLRDRFIQTRWGWRQLYSSETKTLSLLNFPMQADGATMMQMAAMAATERGIHVCCPVHDAFLIMSPLEKLDADVAAMQAFMARSAKLVAKLDIRSAATVVKYPSRYMDARGASMWLKVMSLIDNQYKKDF